MQQPAAATDTAERALDAWGILPDHQIWQLGPTMFTPYAKERTQVASHDLTLGDTILVECRRTLHIVGAGLDAHCDCAHGWRELALAADGGYLMPPGAFVVASTSEQMAVPDTIAVELIGKSSLARQGLAVHQTAGYFWPGWQGILVLELSNASQYRRIRLLPGMAIASVVLHRIAAAPAIPYGDPRRQVRYQHQSQASVIAALEGVDALPRPL